MQALAMRGAGLGLRRLCPSSRPSRSGPRQSAIVAAIDAGAVEAVTQQAVAYAAFVGAEAAFTGITVPASTPGRPAVPQTLLGVAGALAGAALLQQGALAVAGNIAGLAASVSMLAYYGLRVKDTPYDPADWPGAKAWPAGMALVSFFMLAAFQQGLAAALR